MSDRLAAIVVPLFNGREAIGTLLESLEWLEGRDDLILLVVDSGSTDGGPELVEHRAPWATAIHAPARAWWTEATEIGCRYAVEHLKVQRLVLLNHDCQMTESDFGVLIECADSRPRDIICPVVRLLDGRILFGGGIRTSSGMLAIRSYWSQGDVPPSGQVVWCGGMGAVIPVAVYQVTGGFDVSGFPHYYADADFCLRANGQGHSVWFCGEAQVLNDKSTSGVSVGKDSASWALLWKSLTSRKSSVNIPDTVRFYTRHSRFRLPWSLASVYGPHLGSSVKRIVLRRFR